MISRRDFVAISGLAPLALSPPALKATTKKIPVGLEMYSVRDELMKDVPATVNAVAKMGYEVMEFYAPYFQWTTDFAKAVRKQMDDLGVRCNSTHNNAESFTPDGIEKAIVLNQILGSKYIVMASTGRITNIDGWKALGGQLTALVEKLKPLGMSSGFHNHETEWPLLEGKRPMDVLAANTPNAFMLQLDVGTCVAAKADPVAWINANPGRIKSIHCKDWAAGTREPGTKQEARTGPNRPSNQSEIHQGPAESGSVVRASGSGDKGYRVLFGEGDSPWAKIFEAAESVGGVEYYLIEQEGSRYSSFETARRCMAAWKQMRG